MPATLYLLRDGPTATVVQGLGRSGQLTSRAAVSLLVRHCDGGGNESPVTRWAFPHAGTVGRYDGLAIGVCVFSEHRLWFGTDCLVIVDHHSGLQRKGSE